METIKGIGNDYVKPIIENAPIFTNYEIMKRFYDIKQEEKARNIHLNRAERRINVTVNGR